MAGMNEPTQLDLLRQAQRRRDRGLARALSHAENLSLGWNIAADAALSRYLETITGTFLAEQFVAWARRVVGDPPDPRAWGGPIRRAAIAGMIQHIGYAPAASSNHSPKALWRAIQK